MRYSWPNIISYSRILAAPFLIYLLLQDHRTMFVILLVIAAFTDFLDGYVARKFDLYTKHGAVIDAVADKVLVISVLIAFVAANYISLFYMIMLLMRDWLVIGGIIVLSFFNIKRAAAIPHSKSGKVTTVLQFLAIGLLVFHIVPPILYYPAMFIGAWAGIGYIMLGIDLARRK